MEFKNALESESIIIEKIILYGPFASGQFREESDIDIVVISRGFENKRFWDRIDLLSKAIFKIIKPIEAVAMTPEEWERKDSMIADFAKDGEVVYAA